MKADRIYSNENVSFLDVLDPYIRLRIEELITSSNNQATSTSQRPNKGDDLI